MAAVKFNENGEMINVETGQVVGRNEGGRIVIDSKGAEMLSLEDYGVSLPDPPPEEPEDDGDDEGGGGSSSSPEEEKPKKKDYGRQFSASSVPKSHVDSGPTSYDAERTKYEVKKDSFFVIRFGLLEKEDGRMVPILDSDVENFPSAEHHWVKFRMWTYLEQLEWRDWCSKWDSNAKRKIYDEEKLNERKIKCLILDWSFGEKSDRLKLLHCNGVLSDESYAIFLGLYPSIATIIVRLMNLVLESLQ